jgi:hypothetical protein
MARNGDENGAGVLWETRDMLELDDWLAGMNWDRYELAGHFYCERVIDYDTKSFFLYVFEPIRTRTCTPYIPRSPIELPPSANINECLLRR